MAFSGLEKRFSERDHVRTTTEDVKISSTFISSQIGQVEKRRRNKIKIPMGKAIDFRSVPKWSLISMRLTRAMVTWMQTNSMLE